MERFRLALALSGLLATQAGCLIDHDRCDAHQVEYSKDFALCLCEPNAVINPSGVGCTPCGAHELAQNDVCVCEPGYTKQSADGGCSASDIGAACSAETACSAAYPYCVMTSGSAGYCSTSGCARNADCPGGWTCEQKGADRYCSKPRTGLGVSCSSQADCAGFEANYCELLFAHACILHDCAAGGSASCPNEWGCCDYSGLLGSPLSTCVPPEMLNAGSCPAGGVRVNP
ncbi:MAG TPA: hypothetical protein VI299_19465 [Polyangiales bacterium]